MNRSTKLKKWIDCINECDSCLTLIEEKITQIIEIHNNDVSTRDKSYNCIELKP